HAAGGRLQHARDDHFQRFVDVAAAILDDNHGAVVQVSYTLASFAAFLDDTHLHSLAGQHHGLDHVGQFVDVEHPHALQRRDLVQLIVVGDDRAAHIFRQLDQLGVYFAHALHIHVGDADRDDRFLLQAVQDFEPALAPVAA